PENAGVTGGDPGGRINVRPRRPCARRIGARESDPASRPRAHYPALAPQALSRLARDGIRPGTRSTCRAAPSLHPARPWRGGERFEFFHRVDALRLAPGTRRIGRIEMGRQATVKGGGEYDALIDVGGLPCWPGTTDYYDRLEEAEALKRGGYDLEDWWAPWPD